MYTTISWHFSARRVSTHCYINFPDFKQNNTRIAAFGPTTAKAVRDASLILDIEAPLPNAPSMTGALELYIRSANGIK
jgi:uroporphyrinogen-III synthase